MDIKIAVPDVEVVDTVHYMEQEINIEVGNEEELVEIKIILLYNDGDGGNNILTNIEVFGNETTRDCVAEDIMPVVKESFPAITKEEEGEIADKIDKKVDEVIAKNDITEP